MKYVLDASVAIKWVLPEVDSPKALGVRNDYRRALRELIAPDIFKVDRRVPALRRVFCLGLNRRSTDLSRRRLETLIPSGASFRPAFLAAST